MRPKGFALALWKPSHPFLVSKIFKFSRGTRLRAWQGTGGKRVPSGHHGVAVSDPQVKSETSWQTAVQPAMIERLDLSARPCTLRALESDRGAIFLLGVQEGTKMVLRQAAGYAGAAFVPIFVRSCSSIEGTPRPLSNSLQAGVKIQAKE